MEQPCILQSLEPCSPAQRALSIVQRGSERDHLCVQLLEGRPPQRPGIKRHGAVSLSLPINHAASLCRPAAGETRGNNSCWTSGGGGGGRQAAQLGIWGTRCLAGDLGVHDGRCAHCRAGDRAHGGPGKRGEKAGEAGRPADRSAACHRDSHDPSNASQVGPGSEPATQFWSWSASDLAAPPNCFGDAI